MVFFCQNNFASGYINKISFSLEFSELQEYNPLVPGAPLPPLQDHSLFVITTSAEGGSYSSVMRHPVIRSDQAESLTPMGECFVLLLQYLMNEVNLGEILNTAECLAVVFKPKRLQLTLSSLL